MQPEWMCPTCRSTDIKKNGTTRRGKQNYRCRLRLRQGQALCGRQFVEHPQWRSKSSDTKAMIEQLLLEKIPLAGIARVMQVSEAWLQRYVNAAYETVPPQVEVTPEVQQRLNVQMDELWSFVDDKDNEQWVWLAIDAQTRGIVGCYVGDRSGASAKALWDSLPPVYRQCAVCCTDFWSSYRVALPSKRHQAVGKETGKTSYIERLNNTLRQRVARLVRKTLSFSSQLENHIGAIFGISSIATMQPCGQTCGQNWLLDEPL